MREHLIQQKARAVLSAPGSCIRVYRNNVGQYKLPPPQKGWVAYGLAKGSADLVGLVTVTITPEMVGEKFGRFLSVEMKTDTGRASPEQLIWQKTIIERGGIARIIRSEAEAIQLLEEFTVDG